MQSVEKSLRKNNMKRTHQFTTIVEFFLCILFFFKTIVFSHTDFYSLPLFITVMLMKYDFWISDSGEKMVRLQRYKWITVNFTLFSPSANQNPADRKTSHHWKFNYVIELRCRNEWRTHERGGTKGHHHGNFILLGWSFPIRRTSIKNGGRVCDARLFTLRRPHFKTKPLPTSNVFKYNHFTRKS